MSHPASETGTAASGMSIPEDLESTIMEHIIVQGVVAFGGVDDNFFYIPVEGFVPADDDESLSMKLPFKLSDKSMAKKDRQLQFKFKYELGGEDYEARVFARVVHGKMQYRTQYVVAFTFPKSPPFTFRDSRQIRVGSGHLLKQQNG